MPPRANPIHFAPTKLMKAVSKLSITEKNQKMTIKLNVEAPKKTKKSSSKVTLLMLAKVQCWQMKVTKELLLVGKSVEDEEKILPIVSEHGE